MVKLLLLFEQRIMTLPACETRYDQYSRGEVDWITKVGKVQPKSLDAGKLGEQWGSIAKAVKSVSKAVKNTGKRVMSAAGRVVKGGLRKMARKVLLPILQRLIRKLPAGPFKCESSFRDVHVFLLLVASQFSN